MAYEFRLGAVSGKQLGRIARQQSHRLRASLKDAADCANGHHEARKCVKRLRALMQLARPAIGTRQWRGLDRRLSRIARQLSGARDAAVILQTLDLLEREHGAAALGAAARRLRTEAKKPASHIETQADLDAVRKRIDRLDKELKELRLRRFDAGSAFEGLADDYRDGRKALAHALHTGQAEDFHDLRKHVQRHWRHMQLFAVAWPEEMAVRIELSKVLSELLGEDHDLWMLRQRLKSKARPGRGNKLDQLCAERQERLLAAAKGKLAQLFAEGHKELAMRLLDYWDSASLLAGEPHQPPGT